MRVLTREPARARLALDDRCALVRGDLRHAETIAPALVGVRTIVSAASGYGPDSDGSPRLVDYEGNRNLIRAAGSAGVEHMVLVSVHGASPTHPMELMRMKFRAEEELRRSRLRWTIIRPTPFMETWARVVGEPMVNGGKALVLGRGDNPINFVSARDVAQVVARAVVDPAMQGTELEVGGPSNMKMRDLAATVAAVAGRSERCRHVPRSALRLVALLARPISPRAARLAHDAIFMDTSDFTFHAPLVAGLDGAMPRTSFEDVLMSM